MNITYICPQCEQTVRSPFAADAEQIDCPACGYASEIPAGALEGESVQRCFVCPSDELFVRKDFPQQLGLLIIAVGFIAATVTWYYYWLYATFAILFASALVDAVLFVVVGNVLSCYRCHSEYRQVAGLDEHAAFDLEVHEKHRQQAARMANAEEPAAADSSAPPPSPSVPGQ